jgi:hypothetical protein
MLGSECSGGLLVLANDAALGTPPGGRPFSEERCVAVGSLAVEFATEIAIVRQSLAAANDVCVG